MPAPLRPVVALKNQSGLSFAPVTTLPPLFRWVDPTKLWIDPSYQRSMSERSINLIRKIAQNWDWANFKPPVVVETAHVLHVIDGQHTAIAAATNPDIDTIPVMLVEADSVQRRAQAFIGQNTTRVAMTALQLFQAAVTAGDPDAVTAVQICERARVKILNWQQQSYGPRETIAVTEINRIGKRYGALLARQLLQAVADSNITPILARHLRAAELLLHSPGYSGSRMTLDELTATIAKTKLTQQYESHALAAALKIPVNQALAMYWHRMRFKPKTKAA